MPREVENKIEAMIRGEVKYTSAFLGFNLLIARLVRRYDADPSAGVMDRCMQEAREFFKKYEIIMSKEYSQISRA